MHWQWPLIVMLLRTYVLVGSLAGTAAGISLTWTRAGDTSANQRIAASLTIVLAFIANLVPVWRYRTRNICPSE